MARLTRLRECCQVKSPRYFEMLGFLQILSSRNGPLRVVFSKHSGISWGMRLNCRTTIAAHYCYRERCFQECFLTRWVSFMGLLFQMIQQF